MDQSITPFIHHKVVILPQSTPAYTAARTMLEQEIGCILVNNSEGKIVGILTDRDLACQLISCGYPSAAEIYDFISSDLITATENSTLPEVIKDMITYGIRRIPVISVCPSSKKEKCVGLITLDDLIASKAINIGDLSQIIKNQIKRRSQRYSTHKEKKKQESKEHKLHQFFNEMFDFINLSQPLEKETAQALVTLILSLLIQRLPATGAAHFVSHFPALLQEELFDLPVGPNRAITNKFIINEIMDRYQIKQEQAENILKNFWKGLEHTLDFKAVEHMVLLLPEDIRNYSYNARTGIDIASTLKLRIES